MNAWEAIVCALRAEKTEYVFGLPGGDLFYDSLYDAPEIKTVLVREESSGPFMAMAYARLTGKPGVCYGSSGPGVANLVPGIMEAHSACLPVIASQRIQSCQCRHGGISGSRSDLDDEAPDEMVRTHNLA